MSKFTSRDLRNMPKPEQRKLAKEIVKDLQRQSKLLSWAAMLCIFIGYSIGGFMGLFFGFFVAYPCMKKSYECTEQLKELRRISRLLNLEIDEIFLKK